MQGKLTTVEALKATGISRPTLQRWIAGGKIQAPALTIRDGRAVRLWSPSDVAGLRKARKHIYYRGGGRPRREKASENE